jgi:hypothetical protein
MRTIDEVPGINPDMTRFPTAGHLVSGAGTAAVVRRTAVLGGTRLKY